MHHRDAEFHARVVEQVTRWEVVGTVNDDVVAGDDVDDVAGRKSRVVRDDVDIRVQHGEGLFGRVDFSLTDAVDVVQNLTLQVALIYFVHVDDAERADASSRQIQRRR